MSARHRWRQRVERRPLGFDLDIFDFPGGAFSNHQQVSTDDAERRLFGSDFGQASYSADEETIFRLSGSDGIVLFFDPVREREVGDAFEYFHRVITALEYRARQENRLDGQRLPHYLAVCVAKYDEPQILDIARKGGYLIARTDDACMFPRVDDSRVEAFFEDLCRRSPTGGATLVQNSIKRYFHSDRVRYFATSSVGFFLNRSQRFDADDFYNVIDRGNGRLMLRGAIHPINVLEPLLWLAFHGEPL